MYGRCMSFEWKYLRMEAIWNGNSPFFPDLFLPSPMMPTDLHPCLFIPTNPHDANGARLEPLYWGCNLGCKMTNRIEKTSLVDPSWLFDAS